MGRRKQADEAKPGMITGEALSKITGYTDVWHRQAAKAGYFPAPKNGLYQTGPTLQGLFRRERDLREKSSAPLGKERQAKLKAERELLELHLAKAREQLRDVNEVSREWAAIVMLIRQKLLSLPSRLSPRLPYCQSQTQMSAEIETE